MAEMKCPKCDGEMVVGYVLDSRTGGADFPAVWLRGHSKRRVSLIRGPYGQGKPITAYRCEACGYLELYARE